MASTREVSSIAEELWCPACLSILREPRTLSCGHSFCLSCLESCVFSKGQPEGLCPECQKPFSLQEAAPGQDLADLPEKAQLLKLEEAPRPGETGSRYVCEEHEEPLKLFCSQDEAPICVICRDLPQHQSHSFLPVKNAAKVYKEKLKASLEPLEDGVNRTINNQSLQQETIEELEDLYQSLCGSIFIAFEELREILNEREQAMMETVKQMKEDNQSDMENRLEYLKACESSHTETICSIQTALKETNEFAFLKGVKELMGRVQDCLRKENEETGSEDMEEAQEAEEKEGEETDEEEADDKDEESIPGEDDASGEETHCADEDDEDSIVSVEPALRQLEMSLDFEAWKAMLGSITIGQTYDPDFPYCSPPQGENVLQSESSGISEGAKEETAVVEESSHTTDVGTSAPSQLSPSLTSNDARSTAVESTPYKPPLCFPAFSVPLFQQWPAFPHIPVRGGAAASRWMPRPPWGRGIVSPGRGLLPWQLPLSSVGQGRGYHLNPPRPHANPVIYGPQGNWGSPRKQAPQPRARYAWRQGGGSPHKQRPQSHGANSTGESGRDFTKPVSGPDVGGLKNQGPPSGGSISSGDGKGKSTNQQPFKPRGAFTVRRGGSSRLQRAAKKPATPQKEGETSSGTKGAQNRAQSSHRRGRGSGSTKGPQNK